MRRILIAIVLALVIMVSSAPKVMAQYVYNSDHYADYKNGVGSRPYCKVQGCGYFATSVTFANPTRITSVEAWLSGVKEDGDDGLIRFDIATIADPGTNTILRKYTTLPSSRFDLNITKDFDWRGIKDIDLVLQPGTYWFIIAPNSDTELALIGNGDTNTTNTLIVRQGGEFFPTTPIALRIGGYKIDESCGLSPVANAGQDIESSAYSKVILDGSKSFTPDSSLRVWEYRWTRLADGKLLCSTTSPTCEVTSAGWAEELIELSVFDGCGQIGKDTVSIFHKKGASCGNSTVEPPEVCDTTGRACQTTAGYWGTQQCNAQCSGYNTCVSALTCGDGSKDGPEVCDSNSQSCTTAGGYAGTQACNAQCTGFGTCTSTLTCGDGIKNGTEVCDGGSQACTTTGGYAGTQTCNTQCNGYNTCTTALRCGDGICSTPETSTSCPADCTTAFTVTLEAETMTTKTGAGGASSNGWGIWSNGYIESTVNFPTTGTYRFDIIAKATPAAGGWANMELRLDQVTKSSFTVNTTGYVTYTANVSVTAGSRKVAIAFTNDAYAPPEDRNLIVDKVTITK